MEISIFFMMGIGVIVGIFAAFTGLGGGIIMVPVLLYLGLDSARAVGTSLLGILIVAVSALFAHHKLANIDYHYGILLGIGGIAGAQIGARLAEYVPMETFRQIFAVLLVVFGIYLFFKK